MWHQVDHQKKPKSQRKIEKKRTKSNGNLTRKTPPRFFSFSLLKHSKMGNVRETHRAATKSVRS
jgi:hypothetical protein